MKNENDRALRIEEVAAALGLSRQQVDREVKRLGIRREWASGHLVIPRSEVDRMIESRKAA